MKGELNEAWEVFEWLTMWCEKHERADGAPRALFEFLRGNCFHAYRDDDGACDLCGDVDPLVMAHRANK